MICIEADRYGRGYIVRQKDAGFGRGAKTEPISLEAAAETAKHYFSKDHNESICGFCALDRKEVSHD